MQHDKASFVFVLSYSSPSTHPPHDSERGGVVDAVSLSSVVSPHILSLRDGGFASSSSVNFHPRFSQPSSERFPTFVNTARSFPLDVSLSGSPPGTIVYDAPSTLAAFPARSPAGHQKACHAVFTFQLEVRVREWPK